METKDNNSTVMEEYLNELINKKIPATIYLVNGIKLQGEITSFDLLNKCVKVKNNATNDGLQLVFLHAVSTISG
jgi:host factor-I protein